MSPADRAGRPADRPGRSASRAGHATARVAGDFLVRVDKSEGRTSRQVVDDLARRLGRRDVGHAGTLDPMATGLLLVAVGRATRLVPWIHEWDKEYAAQVVLGTATDTLDRTGRVTEQADVPDLAMDRLVAALGSLTGAILQAPPMVSAVKVGGERLYDLARRGVTLEREARPRTVHSLVLEHREGARLWIRVACSSGTYVRVLAESIGAALGVPAHLAELRRTRIGPHAVDAAIPDAALPGIDPAELVAAAEPLAGILAWPAWPADAGAAADVGFGRFPAGLSRELAAAPAGERRRILDPGGRLIALVEGAGDSGPPRFLRVFPAEAA